MERRLKTQADRQPVHQNTERASRPGAATLFIDNHAAGIAQRKQIEAIQNSPRMVAQRQQFGRISDGTAQLEAGQQEELLQGKFATTSAFAVLQRLVSMKGGAESRRTTGDGTTLRGEVQATISGADLSDMQSTSSQLRSSIANRETDLYRRKDKDSPIYLSHQARIVLEQELYRDVNRAIAAATPKAKPKKAKATPPPKTVNSNPFAALM